MNVIFRPKATRTEPRSPSLLLALAAVSTTALAIDMAAAQSLFMQAALPAPGIGVVAPGAAGLAGSGGEIGFAGTLQPAPLTFQQTSLLAIDPPRAREFRRHELVTIIVDEVSRQQAEQSLKTDKSYGIDATLSAALDPWELLEARLRQADIERLRLIDAAAKQRFDGKGRFERNDRFTTKIQAEVIDVKPNGVLVLEARRHVSMGRETTITVLSGICRQEDITGNNTVFSSQIANLTLVSRQEGQVDAAGRKGLISRVLETIFAF
jgi:flagellar L-ring protein FlgH